jgi:hypothetical protein
MRLLGLEVVREVHQRLRISRFAATPSKRPRAPRGVPAGHSAGASPVEGAEGTTRFGVLSAQRLNPVAALRRRSGAAAPPEGQSGAPTPQGLAARLPSRGGGKLQAPAGAAGGFLFSLTPRS